ncbi:MAG: tetratricopeptide repeat protein, partial [Proteobacteria bacterium]|nr:tetratricopeptide repeat protein [Pseudomonadota bacterium]
DRVRITAQLIDTKTEGHVWAERYDRNLEDIFSVQDEVRQKIVTALAVQLTSDDQNRIKTKKTTNLKAYDYFLRGVELHSMKLQGGLSKAREMFQKAIDLDPAYARAYSALGHTWLMEWIFGFDQNPELLDKAFDLGLKAISIDEKDSSGYSVLASVYLWKKQHDKAIEQTKKAIELEPNNAQRLADMGEQLTWAGKPREGIPYIEKAMRLDPKYPAWFLWNLGHAYYLTQQYELAIDVFQRALVKDKDFWPSHVFLALCYDATGQKEKAKSQIKDTLTANKNLPLEKWENRLPYKDPDMSKIIVEKLGKIGIK